MSGVEFGVDNQGKVFAVIDGQPVDEANVPGLLQLSLLKQIQVLNTYAAEAHAHGEVARKRAGLYA